MRTSLSYSFSAMARTALKDPAALTADQLTNLGVAARGSSMRPGPPIVTIMR